MHVSKQTEKEKKGWWVVKKELWHCSSVETAARAVETGRRVQTERGRGIKQIGVSVRVLRPTCRMHS